jgi:hypothetical protein
MQVLIKPECLDSQIRTEASIATVIPVISKPDISVINRILALNQTASFLDPLHERANKENSPYKLEDGILTYKRQLVMLIREEETLVAELLQEIHEQASIAYLSKKKTIALVKACY